MIDDDWWLNMIDNWWVMDWWIGGLMDWWIDGLMDWWIDWLIDWLMDWLIDGLMDWLIDGLIDWLIDWLMDWLIDWWIDWLIDWLMRRSALMVPVWCIIRTSLEPFFRCCRLQLCCLPLCEDLQLLSQSSWQWPEFSPQYTGKKPAGVSGLSSFLVEGQTHYTLSI